MPPVGEPDDKPVPPPPVKPSPHDHPELEARLKAIDIKLNAGADIVERLNIRIGEVEQLNRQNAEQINKQIVDIVNKMPGGTTVDLGPIENRLRDLENRPAPEVPETVDLSPLEQRLTDLENKQIILKMTASGNQLPDSVSGKLGDAGNPYVGFDASKIVNPNE